MNNNDPMHQMLNVTKLYILKYWSPKKYNRNKLNLNQSSVLDRKSVV